MTLRKHSLDETAFDSVTEGSAYWIGFLMADGTINTPKGRSHEIRLDLAEIDIEQVKSFRRFLKSSHKIHRHLSSKGTYAGLLAVSSQHLVSALGRFGVAPRKSHTARVIGLEHDRHFWRGAVDGDGSLYWSSKGLACLSFCGSQAMVAQFLDFVRAHAPDCRASVRPCGSIYRTALLGRHATRVIEVLYGECSVALARKLDRAKEMLRLRSSDLQPKVKAMPVERQRRLAGLCVDCGETPLPNKARCGDCTEKMRGYARKSYHKRAAQYRAEGRCSECGASPLASATLCQRCLDQHNKISRRRRAAQTQNQSL